MRIVIVGRGIIGTAVANLLSGEYEVIRVSRSGGDMRLDATSEDSIKQFYKELGSFDALISAIGRGKIETPFWELSADDYLESYLARALSQINLVRLGMSTINDGGAFVLSSGLMNKRPLPGYSVISSGNGAIDGYVIGAARDMPRGVRINTVSAPHIRETLDRFFPEGLDLGDAPIAPVEEVAKVYRVAVLSAESGQDFDVRFFKEASWDF